LPQLSDLQVDSHTTRDAYETLTQLPKSLECNEEEKEFEDNITNDKSNLKTNICPDVHENGNLSQNATFELFQLAEFYKLEPLVIACCQKIHEELTNETACDLLVRIERYSHVPEINIIKESIWHFITINIRQIKQTRGYPNLVKNHHDLLGQLIDQMTK